MRGVQRQVLLPAAVLASSSVLLLSGCGSAFNLSGPDATGPAEVGTLQGTVHGGQAPVTGATVSLYEIGTANGTTGGYAAALGTALGSAVTNSGGSWSLTPKACTNANDELYLVASGGEEVGNSTANTALVLTSVGGPCGSQFTHNWNIDEVTTVATEYALAGFSTSYNHVGTSAGNTIGLINAFATVNNIVNLSAGTAYVATPAYQSAPPNTSPDVFRSIVPQDTINSLANILATCVNAAAGAADPGCTNLFTLAGSVATTADAALYIAHHPGSNVSSLLALPTPQAPFGPTLTSTPNDLTLEVNYVGGGLGGFAVNSSNSANVYVAIDAQGNVWTPNQGVDSVTVLSNLGAPLSPNTQVNTTTHALIQQGGFLAGSGQFFGGFSGGISIDQSGNAWVSDQVNCLIGISPSGAALSGSPFSAPCSPGSALATAVDASDNVWVAGANFITATSAGAILSGFNGGAPYTSGFNSLSGFIGPDYSGHMWYTDSGNGEIGALSTAGTLYTTTGTLLASPNPYSAFGDVSSQLQIWIPEGGGTENIQPAVAANPVTLGASIYPLSEVAAGAIVADGSSNFFLTMGGGSGVPANVTAVSASHSILSPSATGYTGGSKLMSLDLPAGIAIDQSGNVWVVNQTNWNNKTNPVSLAYTNSNGITYEDTGDSDGNLTEIIGLGAPVQPVFTLDAKTGQTSGLTAAGAYGVKP
jgi:hypothetical protein